MSKPEQPQPKATGTPDQAPNAGAKRLTHFSRKVGELAKAMAAIGALLAAAAAVISSSNQIGGALGCDGAKSQADAGDHPDAPMSEVTASTADEKVHVTTPVYGPTGSCVKDPGRALRGEALQEALSQVRQGIAPLDWRPLIAACELPLEQVASALNQGGLVAHRKPDKKPENYWTSLRLWKMALNVEPSKLSARFNLACSYARLGKTRSALGQLRELLRGGDEAKAWLAKAKVDPDFETLRNHPEFIELTSVE